jgi:hypothetical protein
MSWFHYFDALSSVANPGQRRENQSIEPVRLAFPKILRAVRTVVRAKLGRRLSAPGAVVYLRPAL